MKLYTLNDEGQAQVLSFLAANLGGRALENLDTENAQDSWFSDAERNADENGGSFEIPARMSRTGNPIPATFGPECYDSEDFES